MGVLVLGDMTPLTPLGLDPKECLAGVPMDILPGVPMDIFVGCGGLGSTGGGLEEVLDGSSDNRGWVRELARSGAGTLLPA